jgi:hypothetical protein
MCSKNLLCLIVAVSPKQSPCSEFAVIWFYKSYPSLRLQGVATPCYFYYHKTCDEKRLIRWLVKGDCFVIRLLSYSPKLHSNQNFVHAMTK